MKILKYNGKLLFKLFTKVIIYIGMFLLLTGTLLRGLSYFINLEDYPVLNYINYDIFIIAGLLIMGLFIIAYRTRRYSRAIVYSYTLENGLYLPRLTNEPFTTIEWCSNINSWMLTNSKYGTRGYVEKIEVSKLKYNLIYWLLWGWVDDDCDKDTYPIGYAYDIINKKHFKWAPEFFRNLVRKELSIANKKILANSFAIGNDLEENWTPILSILWMFRNLAYNFNYSMEEMREDDKDFFYYRTTMKFPTLKEVDGKLRLFFVPYHFGYVPYTNDIIRGRCVFFAEDIHKMNGLENIFKMGG